MIYPNLEIYFLIIQTGGDKNNEIKSYGQWVTGQIMKYNQNKEIMSNMSIRKLWKEFITDPKYSIYF